MWTSIPGHPDYLINIKGEVYSLIQHKKLRPSTDQKGYRRLILKSGKTRFIHRLVMQTFVGPCPEGKEVCHNDGNPSNNCLHNLRYDTRSKNQLDRNRHGTFPKGEKTSSAKLTEQDIRSIRMDSRSHRAIARDYGVVHGTIGRIKRKQNWAHVK